MKNTQLNTVSANNILVLNADQITNLVDLVDDQIRAQRINLRLSEFGNLRKVHIGALTHYRHIKRLLTAKEREAARQEAKEEAESRENAEIFEIFKS